MNSNSSPPQPSSQSVPGPLAWTGLWRWLMKPPDSLPEAEQRRVVLASGLQLALIFLTCLSLVSDLLTNPYASPWQAPPLPISVGVLIALIFIYALNRSGRYRPAAILTVVATATASWLVAFISRISPEALPLMLVFPAFSILLCSLLLSARATAMIAVLNLFAIALFRRFIPELTFNGMVAALTFTGAMSVLLIAVAVMRGRDIAQLVERQARALTESEAHLRSIVETAVDSLIVIDERGIIEVLNPAAERLFGYAANEVLGQNVRMLMPSPYREEHDRYVVNYLTTGMRKIIGIGREVVGQRKDGAVFPIDLAVSEMWVGGQRKFAGSIRDISERKQAERALRLQSAALESAANAIMITDRDGQITWVNPAFTSLTGYASNETLGRNPRLLKSDRHDEPFYKHLWDTILAGQVWHGEMTNRRKDGSLYAEEQSITPVRDEQGEIVSFIAIKQDITARKQAEEALQAANEKLKRWLTELEQRTHEIALLNDMSAMLQSCLTAQEAYAIIGNLGQQLFPGEAGAVYVINASHSLVEAAALWGDIPAEARVFAPEECWALRRGHPYFVQASSSGLPCHHLPSPPPAASLCVPMMAQGEAMGMLYLQSRDGTQRAAGDSQTRLPEARQRLAQTVADSVALALANLNLRETLRQQSIRDPLTGLFNRRYLEETLDREVRRATRNQHPLGMVMLDLDYFKRFNDAFGHEAGDALLRELSQFMQSHIRAGDIACRYGGEEFTLILPEASLEVTRQRAEQLREGTKHLHVRHHDLFPGAITLSLGVAVYPDHGATAKAVLRAADEALYRAKQEGRDRVIIAS